MSYISPSPSVSPMRYDDEECLKAREVSKSSSMMITPPLSQHEKSMEVKSVDSPKPNKSEFVDSLISLSSVLMTQVIWKDSCLKLDQLKSFMRETLRRSRSSYSTLQVALYYMYKLQDKVQNGDQVVIPSCPKRCFLVCLILLSKFLQDRNYSMKLWSKISGLPSKELTSIEWQVLKLLEFELLIKTNVYTEWCKMLLLSAFMLKNNPGLVTATTMRDISGLARSFLVSCSTEINATDLNDSRKRAHSDDDDIRSVRIRTV